MTIERWIARRALVLYMSDLSEKYWCAGWLVGWEDYCRAGVHSNSPVSGSHRFDPAEQHVLDTLHTAADCWWPSSCDEAMGYMDSPVPPHAPLNEEAGRAGHSATGQTGTPRRSQ